MLHAGPGEQLQMLGKGMPGGVQPVLKYVVGVGTPVTTNTQPSLQGTTEALLRAVYRAIVHMTDGAGS